MKFSLTSFSLSLTASVPGITTTTLFSGATVSGVWASPLIDVPSSARYTQHGCTSYYNTGYTDRPFNNKYDDMKAGDTCNDACYERYGAGSYFGFECPMSHNVHCQCYTAATIGDKPVEAVVCKEQVGNGGNKHCIGPASVEGLSMGGADIGSIYKVREPVVDCLGDIIVTSSVTLLNFTHSVVETNTLHLEGGELRYEDIGTVRDRAVSLVVTVTSGDYTDIVDAWADKNPPKNSPDFQNGKNGQLGTINVQTVPGKPKSGEGNFKFCFHDTATDAVVPVDRFDFTIFDLDQRGGGIEEKMVFDTVQALSFQLWPNTENSQVKLSCEDGSTNIPCDAGSRTVFHSSTPGTGPDNPTDPSDLSPEQKMRSVAFQFVDTECFEFTYDHYCPSEQMEGGDACEGYTGGNFLFAGAADEIIQEGECVVTPSHSPTTSPATSSPTSSPTNPPPTASTTTTTTICPALHDTKCRYQHSSRFHRLENIESTESCRQVCQDTVGCLFYSWGTPESSHPNVCMGCEDHTDNQEDHVGFNFHPMTCDTTTDTTDSGSFCRLENSNVWNSDSDCFDTPGPSCQLRSIDGTQNSCGPGVPAGFYPDLTRCDAYCKCTGTSAPSEYMILGKDMEWDTHQQGNNVFLPGVFGKNGAWGTNGGGYGYDYQMSEKGKERPPYYCGGGTVVTTTSPTSSPTTTACSRLLEELNEESTALKNKIVELEAALLKQKTSMPSYAPSLMPSFLPSAVPTTLPTTSPGPGPTPAAPTSTGCKKKGSANNGVKNHHCRNKCTGTKPNWYKWPCKRSLCQGSECFFFD